MIFRQFPVTVLVIVAKQGRQNESVAADAQPYMILSVPALVILARYF